MKKDLKDAFDAEMTEARNFYRTGDLVACFHHLERAHILGQRFYIPHVISHWWMLKVGWWRADWREIAGQIARIVASVGSLLGWVPAGNTGGANVSPILPMPIPDDLAPLLENEKEPSLRRFFLRLGAAVVALFLAFAAFFVARHYWIEGDETHDFQANSRPLGDIGSVRHVTVMPMVNWRSSDPALAAEAGVSYLITADGKRILFDLGSNSRSEMPSPLEVNLARMQHSLAEMDMIFLSHHHFDHVGGQRWVDRNTFSGGMTQQPLRDGVQIFAPAPLSYPGHRVARISGPEILSAGIASIGPIDRQLFMGNISEQALAIKLEGRGILLVVGCGHQTLEKIVSRTQALFDDPIYGIVGDLHYPVPNGRMTIAGINLQRIFASGSGPISPLSMDDVEKDFALMASLNLKLLAMGGHDTSDTVLYLAAERFGTAFQAVMVGKAITLPD